MCGALLVWLPLQGCATGGGGATNVAGTIEIPNPTTAGYVGAETCGQCHSRFMGYWTGSAHQTATYTGTRLAGFDATWTNVACEDCHGALGQHALNPSANRPTVPDYEVCATCHVAGTGAPAAWDEWAGDETATPPVEPTGHNVANEFLAGRDPGHYSWCMNCHSGERIEHYQDVVPPPAPPTTTALMLINDPIVSDAEIGVTCMTCHRAHSASVNDTDRNDAFGTGTLCMECHSSAYPGPGWEEEGGSDHSGRPYEPKYNPAGDFIQSKMGFNQDGTEIAGAASPHVSGGTAYADNWNLCVTCHMHENTESPTGHRFTPNLAAGQNACGACHPASYAENLQEEVQARLTALAAYMPSRSSWKAAFTREMYDALSAADQTRFQIAVWNYALVNRDSSTGVHNPEYADDVLDVAEAIISDLTGATF